MRQGTTGYQRMTIAWSWFTKEKGMDSTPRVTGLTTAWLLLMVLLGGLSAPVQADSGLTTRVSVDSAGTQANGDTADAALSANGRFVAFDSGATNLVAGDTNGQQDIFVHDRRTGTTTRVSVDSAGTQANNASVAPALSADGRFVAFETEATNLVAGDTNGQQDIFVHDRRTGTTTRVSVDSAGTQANSECHLAALSADGRFVTFYSEATNLVPGDTNGVRDVFVHDRLGRP